MGGVYRTQVRNFVCKTFELDSMKGRENAKDFRDTREGKVDFKEVQSSACGLVSCGRGSRLKAGFCDHDNELSGS